VKEVEEFMQRLVDLALLPALLTALRSGSAARRARPGKQDRSKKVRFMSLILYERTKHNTCAAMRLQSSSQAPPLPLEVVPQSVPDSNHRPRRACRLQPAGGQERKADVKAGQDSIFCNLGILGTFPKIWEIPKLTLSRETQKLGGHATLERTLKRLNIIFRSVLSDPASTSEIKSRDCDQFGNF
jgi:hypothetical protein